MYIVSIYGERELHSVYDRQDVFLIAFDLLCLCLEGDTIWMPLVGHKWDNNPGTLSFLSSYCSVIENQVSEDRIDLYLGAFQKCLQALKCQNS